MAAVAPKAEGAVLPRVEVVGPSPVAGPNQVAVTVGPSPVAGPNQVAVTVGPNPVAVAPAVGPNQVLAVAKTPIANNP